MTLDEFKMLAEAWGSDVERWPEHLRTPALTIARTPEAATILAEAEQIDRLIVAGRPQISADRIGRAAKAVVTSIARSGRPTGVYGLFAVPRWWLPAASLACAAILGISLGVLKPLNPSRDSIRSSVLTMILGEGSFDWVLR
jgi:hypothetical protein